jgi:hypothetical protein
MTEVQAFFATPTGVAVYGTLAAAFIALISGVAAAVRDGTFTWQAIDAFVRADLMGKVVPIFLFLFAGFLIGAEGGAVLTAAGLAGAAAYVAATVASVLAKWGGGQKQGVPKE